MDKQPKVAKVLATVDKKGKVTKLVTKEKDSSFFAVRGDKGWVGPKGEDVTVLAGPKHATFFEDAAKAQAAGFSPTPAQATLLKVTATAAVTK